MRDLGIDGPQPSAPIQILAGTITGDGYYFLIDLTGSIHDHFRDLPMFRSFTHENEAAFQSRQSKPLAATHAGRQRWATKG